MKNILPILFGILLFANINAQESASSPTMWIGGVVAYTDDNSAYTIGPTFGTMLNQNMAVGGTLTLMGSDAGSGWNIEPYFRNYWPISDNFAFYGDAYFGIGGGDDTKNNDDTGSYSKFSVGARPGIQFWFTQNWSIASTVGIVSYESKKYENDEASTEFNLGIDFSAVNLSFFYHF